MNTTQQFPERFLFVTKSKFSPLNVEFRVLCFTFTAQKKSQYHIHLSIVQQFKYHLISTIHKSYDGHDDDGDFGDYDLLEYLFKRHKNHHG